MYEYFGSLRCAVSHTECSVPSYPKVQSTMYLRTKVVDAVEGLAVKFIGTQGGGKSFVHSSAPFFSFCLYRQKILYGTKALLLKKPLL